MGNGHTYCMNVLHIMYRNVINAISKSSKLSRYFYTTAIHGAEEREKKKKLKTHRITKYRAVIFISDKFIKYKQVHKHGRK